MNQQWTIVFVYIYVFFFININKDEQILQQIWMNPTTGPQCKMLPNNNNTNNNNNNNRVFMNIFIKDELLIICHTTGPQKAWKKSESFFLVKWSHLKGN